MRKINGIVSTVRNNGSAIAKLVIGGVVLAAGVFDAIRKNDDCGKYEPGEIADEMYGDDDPTVEPEEVDSDEGESEE